eukprot:6193534-Pleurochrysis_carterae.AAC.1
MLGAAHSSSEHGSTELVRALWKASTSQGDDEVSQRSARLLLLLAGAQVRVSRCDLCDRWSLDVRKLGTGVGSTCFL